MSSWKPLLGSTALATLLMAQTAAADVTPAQVWADFKGYLEGYGYKVSANEATSGDTLTVSDINMSIPLPEQDGTMTMAMGEMVFAPDGGAVDVSWPASMPITISGEAEGEAFSANILYNTEDVDFTVSGDPGDLTWTFAAGALAMVLDGVTLDGKTLGRDAARADINFTDISGSTKMKTGELRQMDQSMSIATLTYDVAAQDPDNAENNLLIKGSMDGITYSGTGALPLTVNPDDPADIFRSGFDVDGTFSYSSGTTAANFTDAGEASSFSSSSEGGELNMTINGTNWAYDYLVRGLDMNVAGGEIPFPVALKAGEFGGKIGFPVAKTDDPQDVSLGMTLADFEMNDMIWQIFDPGAQLPRDPATIRLDLTGKAKMLFDLFDPEQAEMLEDADMPAELYELTLNTLMVKAVGAMLTGNGAFTFDNSDLETFDGFPRPIGEINAELTGANGLIDKLIAMGLLPEQEAMGFRMMMSMFTVATGDDQMKSKIEINEQGHILANGQRIQ